MLILNKLTLVLPPRKSLIAILFLIQCMVIVSCGKKIHLETATKDKEKSREKISENELSTITYLEKILKDNGLYFKVEQNKQKVSIERTYADSYLEIQDLENQKKILNELIEEIEEIIAKYPIRKYRMKKRILIIEKKETAQIYVRELELKIQQKNKDTLNQKNQSEEKDRKKLLTAQEIKEIKKIINERIDLFAKTHKLSLIKNNQKIIFYRPLVSPKKMTKKKIEALIELIKIEYEAIDPLLDERYFDIFLNEKNKLNALNNLKTELQDYLKSSN